MPIELRLKGALVITGLALLAGCATAPPAGESLRQITPFSANPPGRVLPKGWEPWIVNRTKAKTRYELVRDPVGGAVVLHAHAAQSASGLKQRLDIDPQQRPLITWRWRVVDLIAGADNQDRYSEDAPVRLLLYFDGDKQGLPVREQMLMETAQLLTGQEVPYATLVYVWENRFPPETVLPNAFTAQVKMFVVGTGRDRLGLWKSFERNYAEDFRRAFGAAPGRLIGVGLMTDTDNTRESIEAFYGDIAIKPDR